MLSLYDASVPPMIKFFASLKSLLQKGEKYCTINNIDPKKMLASRLHVDMLPLTFQIQMCSNTAKYLALRIGGLESQVFEDDEDSFQDLYTRIDKTVKLLESLKPDSMNVDDTRKIKVSTPVTSFTLGAADYVTSYAVPNFHFHMTVAYSILRSQGVTLGKIDYMPSREQGDEIKK